MACGKRPIKREINSHKMGNLVDWVWGLHGERKIIEDNDHENILKDDFLFVCMLEKVHDVKLGDSAEDGTHASATSDSQTNAASRSSSRLATVSGLDSPNFRSAYSSRGAMSLVTIAMVGLGSTNGRGIMGARDRQG
ncbi:hypothetical protein REPUB_Repub06bG0099500 [Reevesia pubescens]